MLAAALLALGWAQAPAALCRWYLAGQPRASSPRLSELPSRLDVLSFGELQEKCKAAGLPARGSEKALRDRLQQLELVRRDTEELRERLESEQQQRFAAAAARIERELEQQQQRQAGQAGLPQGPGAVVSQRGAPPQRQGPPLSWGTLGRDERLRRLRQDGLAAVRARAEIQRILAARSRGTGTPSAVNSASDGLVPLAYELITVDGRVAAAGEQPLWAGGTASGSPAGTVQQYESVWAAQAANSAAAPSPRMLNRRIASAPSVGEVLRLHQAHGTEFNEVHLSTCWSRLGRVASPPERRRMQRDASFLGPLRQQTARSLLLLQPQWGARAVANTAHSAAKLGLHSAPWAQLWTGLGQAVPPLLRDFTPQALANTAWAFVRARRATPSMLEVIATEALPRLGEFKPQELANLAWAFATAVAAGRHGGSPRPPPPVTAALFDAIADRTAAQSAGFSAQGLANTAWAFAAAGHPARSMFGAIAAEAEPRLGEFKPQELANLAWAFTKAEVRAPALFSILAARATARLRDFTPKSLEKSAWLKGRVYANKLGEFAPQGLANMAWAFAASGHAAPALFDALSNEATPRLAEFKPQELCNLAWAFATADHPSPILFDAMAARATILIGELFTAQGLANTAWAFAAVGRPAPALFDRIAAEATPRMDEFKPQELANLAWAFATAGERAPELFDALAQASARRLPLFKPQELANVAWAYAAADHVPASVTLFDSAFARRCDESGPGFDDGSLFQLHQWVVWREQELGMADGLPSPELRARFLAAFAARASPRTRLHRQVRDALHSLGLMPREAVRLPEGYLLDLVIQWRGSDVVVQVDGPWRFAGRRPTGTTLVRRRQLTRLGWRLLPLPHWEWSALSPERGGAKKMQTYLLYALEHRVI